jgi:predicted DsbA family dithiol-disulfide isomerase
MSLKTRISIDIFSDIICPWCFIGKRRLELAIAQHRGVEVNITWRAFLLNPAMRREGMDRQAYIDAKFGQAGASFYERIAGTGKEVGINFNFAAITKTPDSRPAHSLVLSAGRQADAVKQALFDAYFLQGRDIGDDDVLQDIADQFGLTHPADQTVLDQINRDLAEANRLNIQGVPFFIIAGEWAISGAHPPETFMPLFDAAIAKATSA